MNSFKHLLMIDLDELIIPYKKDTLTELIAGNNDMDDFEFYGYQSLQNYENIPFSEFPSKIIDPAFISELYFTDISNENEN